MSSLPQGTQLLQVSDPTSQPAEGAWQGVEAPGHGGNHAASAPDDDEPPPLVALQPPGQLPEMLELPAGDGLEAPCEEPAPRACTEQPPAESASPWPGVVPTAHALDVKPEVLRAFYAHGQFSGALHDECEASALSTFASVVERSCQCQRVTLLDMQALLLPSWGLTMGIPFPSKADWFGFIGTEHTTDECIGELTGLRVQGASVFGGCVIRAARWVELLDGTVLTVLMTDSYPTFCRAWAGLDIVNRALQSVREVPWSPELHWAFPEAHKRRLFLLACAGWRLGLNPAWSRGVLPFLAALTMEEAACSRWKLGQRLAYLSATQGGWVPCTVAKVNAASGSVMLDIKPGAWISPKQQAALTRALVGDAARPT